MHTPEVPVRRLSRHATLPAYKSALAAGLDLHACLPDGPVRLRAREIALIPSGIALAIPEGYEGQVRPRSGLACRHGITVANAPGTIDADYRGEILVGLVNLGREACTVEHAMRIAQLVIAPVARAQFVEVSDLEETERGRAGFGSTGVH